MKAAGAAQAPYRVGFSQVPTVLAGRDDVLEAADEAIAVAALEARTPTPLLLVGARGVGKTVLLEEIATRAAAAHCGAVAELQATGALSPAQPSRSGSGPSPRTSSPPEAG